MTSSKPTRGISDSERTVHVLLQHSIDRNRPVIEETLTWLKDHPGRYRRNTAVYSDEQWYHFEVFRYAAALHKIPERLDVVRHFLLHEPKRAYLARVNLTRTGYVQYHHAVHALLLLTARDVALSLCNAVLGLGIPRRRLRHRAMLKQRSVRRFGLVPKLKGIAEVATRYTGSRHEFVHGGGEPRLKELDAQEFIEMALKVTRETRGRRPAGIDPQILEVGIDHGVLSVTRRMRSDRNDLKAAVEGLFDSLVPVYDAMSEILMGKKELPSDRPTF